jgi:hypothetical protein
VGQTGDDGFAITDWQHQRLNLRRFYKGLDYLGTVQEQGLAGLKARLASALKRLQTSL